MINVKQDKIIAMTRNTKYTLIAAPVVLAAPFLALLFKPYKEEIALAALLAVIIILIFFFKGMPKEERKKTLKKRLKWGLITAIFSIALLVYEQYHPQFLMKWLHNIF